MKLGTYCVLTHTVTNHQGVIKIIGLTCGETYLWSLQLSVCKLYCAFKVYDQMKEVLPQDLHYQLLFHYEVMESGHACFLICIFRHGAMSSYLCNKHPIAA